MTASPNLSLPYIVSGQTQPEVPHNSGLNILDTLVCGTVLDRDLTSPPAATDGDRYIVGPSATGSWAGKDGQIAARLSGQWVFYPPQDGWTVYVVDEKAVVRYDDSSSKWKSTLGESILSLRDAAGGTALALASSWTAIPWNTQDRYYGGVGNPFTHSTSSNNHQITLVEAGDYFVTSEVGFQTSVIIAATIMRARLTLAGSEVTGSRTSSTVPVLTNGEGSLKIEKLVTAAAGQILTVEAQKSVSGTTVSTLVDHSRLNIRRV